MTKTYSAPAVDRLIEIIELLAKESRRFGVNEIARSLKIPVNTVFRICKTMEEKGYFSKDSKTATYQLGSRFFSIGQVVGSRIDLRVKALPIMKSLRDTIGETVHLCILREDWMVLLEQVETKSHIRIQVETGSLMHPHASAFGKCLLAYCSAERQQTMLIGELARLTPHTIVDSTKLLEELVTIKEQGYALDMEEYMEGVRCIGAPVHSSEGVGIASIGFVGPGYRLTRKKMQDLAMTVKEAGQKLSAELGYVSRQ